MSLTLVRAKSSLYQLTSIAGPRNDAFGGENFPSPHSISENLNAKTDVIAQRRRERRRRRTPTISEPNTVPIPKPIATDIPRAIPIRGL